MICAVALGNTLKDLQLQVTQAYEDGAKYVECRLDGLEKIDMDELKEFMHSNNNISIIYSLRSEWNSKKINPPLEGRKENIKKIIEMSPNYIDLEYPIDMGLLGNVKDDTIPVLSAMDFEGMAKIAFDSLVDLAKDYNGKCIVKISCMPNSVEELRQIWRWSKKLKKTDLEFVLVGMGQLGQLSRVKSKEIGNKWTYGRFDKTKGEPYLKGMLPISELQKANANDSWHLGSLGHLPENDALRTIYSELLRAAGMNGIFLNIPIQTSPELDQFLLWVEDGILDGVNISSPWQVDVLNKIDMKDRSALIMESANTVVVTKDGLKGYNTQIEGLRRSLEPYALKRINHVFIDGTERIARAVIEVFKNDVKTIVVRDELFSQGNPLFDDYSSVIPANESFSDDFDLVVNCNKPAKGFENVVMLPRKIVENARIVFDPMSKLTEQTPLMQLAQDLDKNYLGGFQFLFYSALSSFELWTKRSIPVSSIRKEIFDSFKDKVDFGFMLNY